MPSAVRVLVSWARLDDLADHHLDLLDRHERERWSRYRLADDRGRFALGATVLRTLVADLDGTVASDVALDRTCPRCGDQHGPVTAPGRPWRCSVSHSGDFAVAAVAAVAETTGVGVDLETRCPPNWPGLLPRLTAATETAPADRAQFLAMWVRKEAVLKATGQGLSRPPASVVLASPSPGSWVLDEDLAVTAVDLDLSQLVDPAEAGPAGAVAVVGRAAVRVDVRRMPR